MTELKGAEHDAYDVTDRNRVARRRDRARYDVATVHAILDSSLICHLAYVVEGQPYCTPTTFWREGERLYWHGSFASRMLKSQAEGLDVCLTVTHVDSLVLARAAFGHSINYRSAMIFGKASMITDREQKSRAMNAFMDRLYPGRSRLIRPPSPPELQATSVMSMPIESASAKIRDQESLEPHAEDYDLPVWAGLIPVTTAVGRSVDGARLPEGVTKAHDLAAYQEGALLDQVLSATHAKTFG